LSFLYENAWLLVLILASTALLLMVLRLWLGRKQRFRLEEDKCGLWRYHKETHFKRREACGELLGRNKKEGPEKEYKAEEETDDKVVAVIAFKGDLRAKEHVTLANLVDEVEVNAENIAEVVVCVESSGGMVAQYGHAFSQMERIRNLGLSLTVCVDVVAASGGYLMSIPANKIIAAPFSFIGSIGVLAFVPNIRKLLTNLDINPRTFTAGRYKRTVSLTDEATPEEVARFQAQLEAIHGMFGAAVAKYRTQVKVEEVTTGEHWTAAETLEKNLGLVDELGDSNAYLLKRNMTHDLVHISQRHSFWEEGVGYFIAAVIDRVEDRIASWHSAL
jgi:serine protease SohB